jgi:hypothetical protein
MHDQTGCTPHPVYNPARKGKWPHSLTYDLRALYIEIDTRVEKALGLIFRRNTVMYTRHMWLQIVQGKSC